MHMEDLGDLLGGEGLDASGGEEVAEAHGPRVNNVVCKFHCGARINVRNAAVIMCALFAPLDFPSLTLRLAGPEYKSSSSVSSTGSVMLAGVRSEENALPAAHLATRLLSKALDVSLAVSDFSIVNVVSNASVGFALNLKRFYTDHKNTGRCIYNPDIFDAVNYRDFGVVFIIFASGKCVVTGGLKKQDVVDGFNALTRDGYMEKYRCARVKKRKSSSSAGKRKSKGKAKRAKAVESVAVKAEFSD